MDKNKYIENPIKADVDATFKSISSGFYTSSGITSDKTVILWGENNCGFDFENKAIYGQLGKKTDNSYSYILEDVDQNVEKFNCGISSSVFLINGAIHYYGILDIKINEKKQVEFLKYRSKQKQVEDISCRGYGINYLIDQKIIMEKNETGFNEDNVISQYSGVIVADELSHKEDQ